MSVTWAIEGAATDSSFKVVARTSGTSARLAVSASSDLSSPTWTTPVTVTNGVAGLAVAGLTAATSYWWGVEVDGVLDPDHRGHLRTFPPAGTAASFTFAAGGCAGNVGATYPGGAADTSNSPIFDTIREADPLFFVHTGDLAYRNLTSSNQANWRTVYDELLANDKQERLYREVPLVYMWDDHDFGNDDSDRTSSSRSANTVVYRERFPHYPLAQPTGAHPIYQSFQVGRVLVVVTDMRSDRDPNSDTDTTTKTMLGVTQRAWLANLLTTTTARFVVWVSTTPYLAVNGAIDDSWGQFTFERAELVSLFRAQGWDRRMCIVSGDNHALATDDGSNNPWGGFPVFHFAALDCTGNVRGGPYSEGSSQGGDRWGTIEITDTGGTTITVTGTGMIQDAPWSSLEFTIPRAPDIGVRNMVIA